MATGLVFDPWLSSILSAGLLNSPTPPTVNVHIYQNNYTPTLADTLASYTEATFAGYAPLVWTYSSWTTVGVTGHVASSSLAPSIWQITAGLQVVYGIYVTDSTNTILLGACRDPNAPVTLSVLGFPYYVALLSMLLSNAP